MEVFHLLIARRDNYSISKIQHVSGRVYSITMEGQHYNAVVLPNSFDFYEKRYHLAKQIPDLVVCFQHDTVVAVKCLSLKSGRIADPFALPSYITDVEKQRHRSKVGSQALLGMYLCGMRTAQILVNGFKATTRKRYIERAQELSKRKRGRPVRSGSVPSSKTKTAVVS